MTDLVELVGEQLMIGLPGPTLREDDVRLFRETRAGGLILYRRNFETPEGLLRLLTALENALGRRLLVGTDHEGGRVIMLGQATTIFPDNLAVAAAGDEVVAARQGMIEGRELRRLGVDLNLAPVLDVLTERYSPNIGIRAYGRDPYVVARHGAARIRGMQGAGLSACAKHFPGKGHSPLDAHLALPTIESTWDEMRAGHLPPFVEAIAAGVDAIMTSHPRYPKLDPSGVPATFSRRIVHEGLRGEFRFGGVIVSDDLEMGAVRELMSVGNAVVRAAAAGHDLLLVCHTPAAQREAAHALAEAYGAGVLPRTALEASVQRVRWLRDRRAVRAEGGLPAPEPDGAALASALGARAVTVLAPAPPDLRGALQGQVAVVFPRFSDLAPRITIEPAVADERGYLTRTFASTGITPEILLVGIEPTDTEIAAAAAIASRADVTVLFLFDAHLYASNRTLLETLQAGARRLVAALLRDPYDAALLAPGTHALTAYGFRRCQLDALIARIGS